MARTFPESGYDPDSGDWNDSLKGDYCWSGVNFGEAAPDVMTPSTWSMFWYYLNVTTPVRVPGGHITGGNIGGRLYFNLSVISSLYHAIGVDARKGMFGDLLGSIPLDLDIPYLPFTPFEVIWYALPGLILDGILTRRDNNQFSDYIEQHPELCRSLRSRIRQCTDPAGLLDLWVGTIWPARRRDFRMLRSTVIGLSEPATRLNQNLIALVGKAEANTLQSNLSGATGDLECLGPLMGLAKVKSGRLSREEYMQRYGHRGPHEAELSAPGADDDPDWLEKRLNDFSQSDVDAEALLAKQRAEFNAAWQRFEVRFPDKVSTYRRRLQHVTAAAKRREITRSESIRMSRIIRQFLLQVGNVTGIGEDVFFLTLDEISAFLAGDRRSLSDIPVRKEMHTRYSTLPPYPAVIYGRFDPFQWAADPNRRSDYYDARQGRATDFPAAIKGLAGAAGCVEGSVRRIDRVEDGYQLQSGEILVTTITNVGWTPLFPRLAAIVTDVGAPLSHAAIVARELGIPAVVGCGNATMLLKTGDRVLVDGGAGTVTVLERPST
jgi:phosphohistidine swiveling domain-containing protein